jgi:DNA mismatch repair protein MutS
MTVNLKDSTPLMRQYFEIKSKYPDTVLLYRMGDFYETFDEDARTVHKILGITLTKRANGKASDVALAGFPHHALDSYLPKLIRAGFRVAVCEQLEDPKFAKGIVKRDVTEIVTPGTTLSDRILEQRSNNYLACVTSEIVGDRTLLGLAFVDASTGEFAAGEFPEKEALAHLQVFAPSEIVVPYSMHDELKSRLGPFPAVLTRQEDWLFSREYTYDLLLRHFKTHSLKGFGLEEHPVGIVAAGAVLHYLRETQRSEVGHIRSLRLLAESDYMILDRVTLRNLDVFEDARLPGRTGTLIAILDRTRTPMGARKLKNWIGRPLKVAGAIRERLDAVEEFVNAGRLREEITACLKDISDIERLISKVCAGRATPRDIRGLCESLKVLPDLTRRLEPASSAALLRIRETMTPMDDLTGEIDRALNDDPPASLKDGGVIRDGYSAELDEIRKVAREGKQYIANLQQRERERTGIGSLKVQYNQVFGYYIEVTNTHKDKVPADYIRKQTMTNAERFVTPELKEYEDKVLHAEERLVRLEQERFEQLCGTVSARTADIQTNAGRIAELDCYTSLAEVAVAYKYVKPTVDDGPVIRIEEGRHPVVERLLPPDEPFIPNDLFLDEQNQIYIITGPNMAGKSCYLRQVGLIVLLAQIGCFVPARSAAIGLVDKIFTRVGASDNMAAGESTFLVEMNEAANILNNATSRSLILLDEIGRGTSTFDGLSIAWAMVEHLHMHPDRRPKTLFATHYHELVEIEELLPRVRNYNMEVKKYGDKVVFLRKLVPGGCDHSYGIEVARLAGLPDGVIERAREVMRNLESHELSAHKDQNELLKNLRRTDPTVQMTMFEDGPGQKIKAELARIDPDQLTPLEALNKLSELKKLLE